MDAESSSLFYNPKATRLLLRHGFTKKREYKAFKTRMKGVTRGQSKLDRFWSPSASSFPLCFKDFCFSVILHGSRHF